ncbi:MAG: YraN family protein [bacterium]|nr:YraN family protein [bacterium]
MKRIVDYKTKETGNIGEITASNFVINRKYRIIHRNFHIGRYGEIDIIAQENSGFWPFLRKTNVFIEVKTLKIDPGKVRDFIPEMHINERKSQKLLNLAQIYLSRNGIPMDSSWRIDVIAVEIDCFTGNILNIRHHKNAIHL